jgi:hypothetical protein
MKTSLDTSRIGYRDAEAEVDFIKLCDSMYRLLIALDLVKPTESVTYWSTRWKRYWHWDKLSDDRKK